MAGSRPKIESERGSSGPWRRHALVEGEAHCVRVGPAAVWMQRRGGEIWIASQPVGGGDGQSSAVELDWSRWAMADPEGVRDGVELRPAFPDRPLIVGPELPFRLLPGAEARIYVRVPLWIQVLGAPTSASDGLLLAEFPTVALSDTWWGGFEEGELAYWLQTSARRRMQPELFAPHLAACPVLLVNRSSDDLRVEKFSLRVSHLSLYAEGDRLWGEGFTVTYEGEGVEARIAMAGRAPDEAPGAVRIAGPREPAEEGLRARTFQRLMSLPGMPS